MSDANSSNQTEKAAKIRRKPERENVLSPTFAAVRQAPPDRYQQSRPAEGNLLQRQCRCGKHTIAGGVCEECQQKGEVASYHAPAELVPAALPDIQTTQDSAAAFNLSNIPVRTSPPANGQPIQPSLTVNAPGDQYEQEADRVAETMMRMSASPPPSSSTEITSFLHPTIKRLPAISPTQIGGGNGAFQAPAKVETRINQMQGGGQPLPDTERDFFEERMGYNFSSVRVHTAENAVQASRDIQAHAFTVGNNIAFDNNIAFNEGAYRPGTDAGRRLLAQAKSSASLQRDPDDELNLPLPNFQLPEVGNLSLPEAEGPNLGIGELSLDTSPFLNAPIDSVLTPNTLFQIPPDLIESLLNEWRLQYLLLHPGPPPAQNAWEQVWSAWRDLTNEWLAQGEGAPFNRQLAQDTIRDRAAEAVMAQLAGEEPDSGPDVGEIADKVWQAFERALNRTTFYPRLRANAEAAAAEHWPALAILLGGAVGASLGLGLSENEWRPIQTLTGLLPQLNHDFELGGGWTLSLGFDESDSIPGEEGSVIGINPQMRLTWENEYVRLNLGGFTNLRIEGESGDVLANPGGNVTLDILAFE